MIIKKDFRVGFRCIYPDLKIKNESILNLFAEIAGVHSEKIGMGFGTTNLRWLLTGYKVNIIERPMHGDDVTVVTWSAKNNSAITSREFEVFNENGKLLMTANSNWVLVNFDTKHLEKITDEHILPYESETEKTNFGQMKLPKILEPKNYEASYDFFVDWKWMDLNGHINNTYYVDIADHFLPDNVKEKLSSLSFEVLYKKEIPENTMIKCLYAEAEDAYYITFKSEDLSVLHAIVKYIK